MIIALYETITPGNIGAVARLMKNFGLTKLWLVRPKCNHLSEEALQRACHGKDLLINARIISEGELFSHYVIGTTSKAFTRQAHRQAVTPESITLINDSVILFGREDNGLPNSILSKCDNIITIPLPSDYKALNLSHSVAIILYELTKKRVNKRLINKQLRQQLISEISDLADLSGRDESIKGFIKNVINRSIIYKKEFMALIGLAKAIKKFKK